MHIINSLFASSSFEIYQNLCIDPCHCRGKNASWRIMEVTEEKEMIYGDGVAWRTQCKGGQWVEKAVIQGSEPPTSPQDSVRTCGKMQHTVQKGKYIKIWQDTNSFSLCLFHQNVSLVHLQNLLSGFYGILSLITWQENTTHLPSAATINVFCARCDVECSNPS